MKIGSNRSVNKSIKVDLKVESMKTDSNVEFSFISNYANSYPRRSCSLKTFCPLMHLNTSHIPQ